jgi:hypothetical protein
MLMIFSSAKDFWFVQKAVADITKGRILVGHALHNDLKVRISGLGVFFYFFIGLIFSRVEV